MGEKNPYDRNQYRSDAEYGLEDARWTFWKGFRLVFVIAVILGILGYFMGWFGEGAQVIREEFGPRATLVKYEWFKDTAAQLDKKQADTKVYANRQKSMEETYKGTPRIQWPREDREQFNLWEQEVAGIKASYNMLAADYNAQMAKFNWAFAERGKLPEGATDPLPREYKPYEEK